jgi:hypothetical protein
VHRTHDASVAVATVPTLMCVARRGTYAALAKLGSYITLHRERETIIVEEASTMHGWINTPGAQHGQTSKFVFCMKLPVVLPRPADQVSHRDSDSR